MSQTSNKLDNPEDLAILIRKRGTIKARITKFKEFLSVMEEKDVSNITTKDISDLNLRLAKMNELFTDFENVQTEIETVSSSGNLEKYLQERFDIETQFFSVMSSAQDIVLKREERVEGGNRRLSIETSNSQNINSQIKLPTIKLPNFDGNYLKWLEFRDTFDSLIRLNDAIPDISKFHYLRSSLEGGAAVAIKSIDFTAENFNIAWELLCNRYNNKNVLINNHLKSFFNLESLNRESHRSLRFIIDHVTKNLRALNALGEPTEKWDTLIIYIVVQKLDNITSVKWEEHKVHLEGSPSLDEFYQFLRHRADILETVQGGSKLNPIPTKNERFTNNRDQRQIRNFFASVPNKSCFICNQNHRLYECKQFLEMTVEAREAEVSKRKLCLNCLRPGHSSSSCRLNSCRVCNKKHNSLLCKNNNTVVKDNEVKTNSHQGEPSTSTGAGTPITTLTTHTYNSEVLLGTALVEVVNEFNNITYLARVLLDCGSQSSFITENLKNKLNIKTNSTNSRCISGLNNSLCSTSEYCNLKIKSRINTYNTNVHCMIIPNIAENLPSVEVNPNELNLPNNIALADPGFYIRDKIDILLGSDIMWNIVKGGCQIPLGENGPVLIYSKLGWLVSGPAKLSSPVLTKGPNSKILCHFSQEIKDALSKFWDLETFTIPNKTFSKDEQICEDTFNKTTIRLDSGRFQVTMPLRESPEALGDSYSFAKRCFYNLERRFQKQPKLKEMYSEFIHEYAALGHLIEIDRPRDGNYLAHHPVLREKSETTKLRVVFNASARTASGKSLNDIQHVGPVVQNDLLSILLRFRQHRYVLTGDIEKMYRQVLLTEPQRRLQLILWRDSETQPLKTLQLQTVTYGTASAPYLATRCIVQVANECIDKKVANVIKNDFYCDDLITGCDSQAELKYIRDTVVDKLAKACFPLRKFRTNVPNIFETDASSTTCTEKDLSQINDQYSNLQNQSSVLGLNWRPSQDELYFTVDFQIEPVYTKRNILAATCKIFDPLGLISACTIVPKLLLQKLWQSKLDWDDPVPVDVGKEWNAFVTNLKEIEFISIPRYVLPAAKDNPVSIELHCFVDASQNAFATCIYIRCTHRDSVSVMLMCAKARVAPLKPTTIPRLELAAALLGAQLSTKVCQSLRCKFDKTYFWSDSTIVLGWIKTTNPSNLKQFVYNRVNEIHELTDKSSWNHVPTELNPADIASRGLSPSKLPTLTLWWNGPTFLKHNETEWPSTYIENTELPELKVHTCVMTDQASFDFNRFSNFHKMIRVVGYILRFIHNCKCKGGSTRLNGILSNDEIDRSTLTLIAMSQRESFPSELQALHNKKPLNRKSRIMSLNPYLDGLGVIRVGGRIQNSNCEISRKHPILLCSSHNFTKLLFAKEHLRHLHCGPQLLLNIIRDKFWPLGGRDLARRTFRKCIVCLRIQGRSIQPMMGNLPPPRVTLTYPFLATGIDFAGPFLIANRKGRGCTLTKCWLCLFICLSTKALTLELVSSLSTEAFLMTLRRFISRRGKPHDIYCDNGTAFVGANNELGRMLRASQRSVNEAAHDEGIKFHFIPAYSPHFGGAWEAGIKSSKLLLKRVIGNAHLTFEELATLFTQIEAILNSRPLTPQTSDPSDMSPLTPGHFLIGRPLTALPELPITTNCPNRYQKLQQLKQHFWKRFHNEYLSELQQRSKWRVKKSELQRGDLVIIKDDNLPPMRWRLGRVHQLYPGSDGITRVADFATAKGIVKRALNRVCLLPVVNHEDSSLGSQGSQGGESVHAHSA